ncbi:MAG: hypothetical protein ACRENO_09095 [Thermodesulfobacteriota bacterium]
MIKILFFSLLITFLAITTNVFANGGAPVSPEDGTLGECYAASVDQSDVVDCNNEFGYQQCSINSDCDTVDSGSICQSLTGDDNSFPFFFSLNYCICNTDEDCGINFVCSEDVPFCVPGNIAPASTVSQIGMILLAFFLGLVMVYRLRKQKLAKG